VVPSRTPFVRRRRHGYAATPRTREAPTPESRSLRSGCGNAIHRIATERSSRSSSHAPHFPRRRAPVPVGPCAVGPTGCGPLRRNPPFAPHYARSVLRSLRFPLAPLTTSLRCYDAGAFSTTPLTPSLPLAPIVSVGLTTRYRLLRRSRCSAGSALPLRYVAPARRKADDPPGRTKPLLSARRTCVRRASKPFRPWAVGRKGTSLARAPRTRTPHETLRNLSSACSVLVPVRTGSLGCSLVPLHHRPSCVLRSPRSPSSSASRRSFGSTQVGNRRRTRLASETCGLGDAFHNRVKPLLPRRIRSLRSLCAGD